MTTQEFEQMNRDRTSQSLKGSVLKYCEKIRDNHIACHTVRTLVHINYKHQ